MRSISITLSVVLLLMIIGCSSSGSEKTVQPPVDFEKMSDFGPGHNALGFYDLYFDLDAGEITSVQSRSATIHYNVTGYLNDPNCPNNQCIYFYLWDYDFERHYYYVDIYLLNPTLLEPFDPRVIFITSDYPDDYDVINADSFTRVFDADDEFPENVNPFIALGKDEINQRRLPPFPLWETETVVLYINPLPEDEEAALSYLIDVNWPGRCREPYEINHIQFLDAEVSEDYLGKLNEVEDPDTSDFTIACDVFDWQDDVIEVSFYAPDIFHDEDWRPLDPDPYGPPERWVGTFENITDVYRGYYETWFRAVSDEPTHQVNDVYQRFYFPVYYYDSEGIEDYEGHSGVNDKRGAFAFIREVSPGQDIFIQETKAGGWWTQIDVMAPGSEEYTPVLGYDTQPFVIFASNDGTSQVDLFRVNYLAPSPVAIPLTNDEAFDWGPCIHPDYPNNNPANMDVVFQSFVDGDNDLWYMNIDPISPPVQLTNMYGDEMDPCFLRLNGQIYVAFSSNIAAYDNHEIFIMDLITLKFFRITYSSGYDMHPAANRTDIDTTELAFQTDRNGDFDIYKWMINEDIIVPVFEEDYDQWHPCYSPNGQQIVFASEHPEGEQFDLWTVPYDGNNKFLFQRTSTGVDEFQPDWFWLTF